MLNFASKTFKMLEFTPGIDLLLSDSQHFEFCTNACTESYLEKIVDLAFIVPPNFGAKFKIQKKVLTFC